jgi:hypothetical protein
MSDHRTRAGLDDDELLAQLRQALEALDPVPADAVAAAVAAADLGRVDDELADLLYDSLLDESTLLLRHAGTETARSLGFLAQGYRVDIELIDDEGLLLGQLEPAAPASIDLETRDDTRHVEVDELGRFRFEVRPGSLRLRITLAEGVLIVTPWITW